MEDITLDLHPSFNKFINYFQNIITAMAWLKLSIVHAERTFSNRPHVPYIVDLPCSVIPDHSIKIPKSILNLIKMEGLNKEAPLFSSSMINFYRIMTIALKDIIWSEPDFSHILISDEMQFLRHIRNASAHDNSFYFGNGIQRIKTLQKLPVTWRSKVITESIEGSILYMDFLKPGDLFVLLSDISSLAMNKPYQVN